MHNKLSYFIITTLIAGILSILLQLGLQYIQKEKGEIYLAIVNTDANTTNANIKIINYSDHNIDGLELLIADDFSITSSNPINIAEKKDVILKNNEKVLVVSDILNNSTTDIIITAQNILTNKEIKILNSKEVGLVDKSNLEIPIMRALTSAVTNAIPTVIIVLLLGLVLSFWSNKLNNQLEEYQDQISKNTFISESIREQGELISKTKDNRINDLYKENQYYRELLGKYLMEKRLPPNKIIEIITETLQTYSTSTQTNIEGKVLSKLMLFEQEIEQRILGENKQKRKGRKDNKK